MPCDTHGPFPLGAVRDLLAIARALYRATPPDDAARRARLEEIGQHLTLAHELASKSGAGTLGRSAAWNWAEKGTAALGELAADGSTVEGPRAFRGARIRRRS